MRSMLLGILVLFLADNAAIAESVIQPVRIRSDAMVIDKSGKIIGVPNISDSRNNRLERFYYSIDENGQRSIGSTFKVTNNPHKPIGGGLVRINVKSEEDLDGSNSVDYVGHNNSGDVQVFTSQDSGNKQDTISFNNDNIEKSRYDFGGALPSRYGDF